MQDFTVIICKSDNQIILYKFSIYLDEWLAGDSDISIKKWSIYFLNMAQFRGYSHPEWMNWSNWLGCWTHEAHSCWPNGPIEVRDSAAHLHPNESPHRRQQPTTSATWKKGFFLNRFQIKFPSNTSHQAKADGKPTHANFQRLTNLFGFRWLSRLGLNMSLLRHVTVP